MRTHVESLKENKIGKKLYNLKKIFSKELWKQTFRRLIWKTLPRHRHVDKLASHLEALPEGVPDKVKYLRDRVFREVALGLKRRDDRETLSILLNECREARGVEQIFFTAIYPFIRKRNFVIVHHPTGQPGRMDIELGYEGHSNEYVFWILEIDGSSDERAGSLPQMRWKVIDNSRCPIYHIGAAAIFDRKNINSTQLIINAQNIFVAILEDLKKNGFRTRQPKEIKSIVPDTAEMSLIERWSTIKQAAKRKAKRGRR